MAIVADDSVHIVVRVAGQRIRHHVTPLDLTSLQVQKPLFHDRKDNAAASRGEISHLWHFVRLTVAANSDTFDYPRELAQCETLLPARKLFVLR